MIRVVEGEMLTEESEIAVGDGAGDWFEAGCQAGGLWTFVIVVVVIEVVEMSGWEAAEDDVGCDQVDKDETALAGAAGVAEGVCFLEYELGAEEMVVGELEAAEVV